MKTTTRREFVRGGLLLGAGAVSGFLLRSVDWFTRRMTCEEATRALMLDGFDMEVKRTDHIEEGWYVRSPSNRRTRCYACKIRGRDTRIVSGRPRVVLHRAEDRAARAAIAQRREMNRIAATLPIRGAVFAGT